MGSCELADLEQRVTFLRAGPARGFSPGAVLTALPPRRNSVPAALRDIVASRPRIVHGWLLPGNLLGALARVLAPSIRLVPSERNLGDELSERGRRLERFVARMETVTTANSTAVRDEALARIPARSSKMQVVLPRIETPERPARTIATGAVMVGRLHPVKDHATTLRAWAQLGSPGGRPTLTPAGDGPERGRLQALAGELDIADAVHFVGETDPRPHPYGASVFVSTSLAEGFSRGLLETLPAGVPCVATAAGGALDLPAGTVRRVPAREPGVLAVVLRDVFADPDASRQAAATAHVVATSFSMPACHRRHRRLYAELGSG